MGGGIYFDSVALRAEAYSFENVMGDLSAISLSAVRSQ